ncbi:hypothetical protein DEO23_07970 [Brachybacterium endophyticum]|uniref:HNH nuclease domain-containing protein n=1 Tax=Brachybacterium endophyticum TaxID=2182385 RepID=A0A2U2RMJ4_9MICO|nr:hypothetical protein DEO23_07970 [Brachybacterium endophyticum]
MRQGDAERLGTRIQAHAAHVAEAECRLLLLIGEFDAGEGVRWYVGLKSTAHWLCWACSMSPGAAREHVRVARALREMPLTVQEFSRGALSYSKVREMTRVAALVDEAVLVGMAREMTASQLARTISSFRADPGSRMSQDARREASWQVRSDGMVEIRALLPAELGAEVVTALDLALQHDESTDDDESSRSHDTTPEAWDPTNSSMLEQRRADVFVELARAYLDAGPQDRSGEDRHLVLVHATPDMLVEQSPTESDEGNRPKGCAEMPTTAGTGRLVPERDMTPRERSDVPAGTSAGGSGVRGSSPSSPDAPVTSTRSAGTPRDRCGVVGLGPLEARTAQRLSCTGRTALLLTDHDGEVLHLGRSRRLASPAQRRALRATQRTCQFPGCHQVRHLDAHHLVPWSQAGATDIDNLVLLCRRHHVMVHEGGLSLHRTDSLVGPHDVEISPLFADELSPRFVVRDDRGRPVQATWPPMLENACTSPLAAEHPLRIEDAQHPPMSWGEGDTRIAPTTGGFGFSLDGAVTGLCQSPPPRPAAQERGEDPTGDSRPDAA